MIRIRNYSSLLAVLLFILILFNAFILQTNVSKLSVHIEAEVLNAGKKVRTEADLYWQQQDGKMLTHYTYPLEYIFISNNIGETQMYFPHKNEVQIKQSPMLSSENDMLYFFLNNRTGDMGLDDLNFRQEMPRFEDNLMITKWLPPVNLQNQLSYIETVHQDYLPIYTAYYSNNQKIVRKIYYSQYITLGQLSLPMLVTEMSYLANGDSVISRKIFSDLKINAQAQSQWFNFTIPTNAKIIK